MQFVPIEPAHYQRLAQIHAVGMAGGFLPSLGVAFLERLYVAMFASGAARGVAAIDGGEVVGFCYYTDDHHTFFARCLRHSWWPLAWRAGLAMVRRPRLFLRLIETVRYGSAAEVPGVSAEIYAWAVDPSYRRQRIGWSIVDATEDMMRAEGIEIYKHAVYEDNDSALDFYHKRGHVRVGSFELYGKTWGVYTVDIAHPRPFQLA